MSSPERSPLRKQLPVVALEAFLIVLGVGLAYLSTAWYENRKEARSAEEAMASIVEEIRENRGAVFASLEYHGTVRETLVGALRSGTAPERNDFPRGYIGPAELATIAWDLANARGAISTLPYSRVLDVSRLYSEQEDYQNTARDVGRLIYATIFESGGASILDRPRNLLEIVGTFLYQECGLLVLQDEVLASLDAADSGAAPLPDYCAPIRGRGGD